MFWAAAYTAEYAHSTLGAPAGYVFAPQTNKRTGARCMVATTFWAPRIVRRSVGSVGRWFASRVSAPPPPKGQWSTIACCTRCLTSDDVTTRKSHACELPGLDARVPA